MTNEQALAEIETLARNIKVRGGMSAGYVDVMIGAGNPKYFYQVTYKSDVYGPTGWAHDSPPAVMGNGATLAEAVSMLLASLKDGAK